jgi:hypothetical protein
MVTFPCEAMGREKIVDVSQAMFAITGSIGHMASINPLLLAAAGLIGGWLQIGLEMRKPSYHGVMWKMINPNLETWFRERVTAQPGGEPEAVSGRSLT